MGGDHAPAEIVAGAVRAAVEGIPVTLVGREAAIRPLLARRGPHPAVLDAPDVVGMGDAAVAGVRRSERSSLRVALRSLRDGGADAVVSCGNTGAVLVGAVLDLGVLPGVDRPAICTVLPRADGGRLFLLDAGANVDCKPEQLVAFAALGVAYAEASGVPDPRVGLLSNGEEDGKGNVQVKATLPLLRASGLRVVGNVEPSAAMEGACDVLVTDGFVGNVLLKAAEGAVTTVVQLLRQEIRRTPVVTGRSCCGARSAASAIASPGTRTGAPCCSAPPGSWWSGTGGPTPSPSTRRSASPTAPPRRASPIASGRACPDGSSGSRHTLRVPSLDP